jgi:hypothetical protein
VYYQLASFHAVKCSALLAVGETMRRSSANARNALARRDGMRGCTRKDEEHGP